MTTTENDTTNDGVVDGRGVTTTTFDKKGRVVREALEPDGAFVLAGP